MEFEYTPTIEITFTESKTWLNNVTYPILNYLYKVNIILTRWIVSSLGVSIGVVGWKWKKYRHLNSTKKLNKSYKLFCMNNKKLIFTLTNERLPHLAKLLEPMCLCPILQLLHLKILNWSFGFVEYSTHSALLSHLNW